MIQQLYDPSLEIVSFGGLFWIFMGNLKQLVKEGVKAQLGQGTAEVHLA